MEKVKKVEKIGKFNLLKETTCGLKCDCGFNLWIGGNDKEDLVKIKKFLRTLK